MADKSEGSPDESTQVLGTEMSPKRVEAIVRAVNEATYGSGCLALELDSFAHYADHDAGITSLAFDTARSRHASRGGAVLKCHKCDYALKPKHSVQRNVPRSPQGGGATRIYPMEAYKLERISEGDCPRIESLEQRLGELGLFSAPPIEAA